MSKYDWNIIKIKQLNDNNRAEIEGAEFDKSVFLKDGFFFDVVKPVLQDGVEAGAFYSDLIINDSKNDKRISIEIHSDPEDINVENIDLIFRPTRDMYNHTECEMVLDHLNAGVGRITTINKMDYYLSDTAKDDFFLELRNLFEIL